MLAARLGAFLETRVIVIVLSVLVKWASDTV